MKYQELSEIIINCFYKVYNKLGYGFLEKVYENAMIVECRRNQLLCEKQLSIPVYYDNTIVGNYVADLVIENKIIVELKAISALTEVEKNQLLNYLSATHYEVGLLLNFGKQPQVVRKVYDNEKKKYFNKIRVNP